MLTTRALRKADWPHIEALFGANGACGGCWCMFWRVARGGKFWAEQKGEGNRRAFRALVESGAAGGVLAFEGRAPVGWASVAPRVDFAYFDRSRTIPPAVEEATMSVTCFFVERGRRGQGVARALLEAAVAYAAKEGAALIEGYPSVVRPGVRQADAFVHTGVPALFKAAGFRRAATAGAREVWRKFLK